jgi:antitoxin (DNA-binding transcriptional repressor) of toxin-antitoxin stability system
MSRYRSRHGYGGALVKFLSTRDLRNRPGYVRDLAREDDLVLTANGKPIAILVGVENDEFEETARAIRQAKSQRALSRMRRHAARRGLDRLPAAAIEAEIRAVRSKRKSR